MQYFTLFKTQFGRKTAENFTDTHTSDAYAILKMLPCLGLQWSVCFSCSSIMIGREGFWGSLVGYPSCHLHITQVSIDDVGPNHPSGQTQQTAHKPQLCNQSQRGIPSGYTALQYSVHKAVGSFVYQKVQFSHKRNQLVFAGFYLAPYNSCSDPPKPDVAGNKMDTASSCLGRWVGLFVLISSPVSCSYPGRSSPLPTMMHQSFNCLFHFILLYFLYVSQGPSFLILFLQICFFHVSLISAKTISEIAKHRQQIWQHLSVQKPKIFSYLCFYMLK